MRFRVRSRMVKILTVVTVLSMVLLLVSQNVPDHAALSELYKSEIRQIKYFDCGTIHIGIVAIGFTSNVQFYTMLKSLYLYRNNPLHFHIIVDDKAKAILRMLFESWDIPDVTVSFYNTNVLKSDFWWIPSIQDFPNTYKILKLVFPQIISTNLTKKLIVLDTDLLFSNDIYHLWNFSNKFKEKHFIGLTEIFSNGSYTSTDMEELYAQLSDNKRFSTKVFLYHLEHLQFDELWLRYVNETVSGFVEAGAVDQDLISTIILMQNPSLVYRIPCYLYHQLIANAVCYNDTFLAQDKLYPEGRSTDDKTYNELTIYDGSLLKGKLYQCAKNSVTNISTTPHVTDICFEFKMAQHQNWRTLIFFHKFEYIATKDDVTLVSQLSYSRLNILKELTELWDGPMSLAIYATDAEFNDLMNFTKKSTTLQNRHNIAYHVVFKEGVHYPINMLRNVALRNVVTPYVFLVDIDFLPMQGLYQNIKNYIGNMTSMEKKALVVPAFETKIEVPKTKAEVLQKLDEKILLSFHGNSYRQAHAPTNYTRWRTAQKPYQVAWKLEYEPYVVVQRNVTEYDKRFFGYGWNKVSHIMELKTQGYEFWVLPNAFIIHKAHKFSKDRTSFLRPRHQRCLQNLKRLFVRELKTKYLKVTTKNK